LAAGPKQCDCMNQAQLNERLEKVEARYEELAAQLGDTAVIADNSRFQKVARAHADLGEIVEKYREWKAITKGLEDTRAMLGDADPEMREMAEQEMASLQQRVASVEQDLKILLTPKDPNDEKNVVLEIRAGTGGDEATLFAAEMYRMYARYAESQGWRVEVISQSFSSVGGLKEVIAVFEGRRVYSKLKYESGVHRVQRVPATEQQGRLHTSAITVAVLPEAEEVDIDIDPKDIRVDTFCSSGPGGQSVNTTYSAVRITHLPTSLVVSCQDEKSQIKNRAKAMRVLRARLYELEREKQQQALAQERRAMVGTGDRSEKIRTYNFRENRVTDHRIGFTLYQLSEVMDGKIHPVIDALTTHYQAEKLKDEAATALP
jgi:peptide chain release factor 1